MNTTISILIIKKNGDIEIKNVKKIEENEIFKFCGYKNDNNFSHLHTFIVNNCDYNIYGKSKGKANYENKYELPPPIDTNLYFGTICIIKKENNNYSSLDIEEWEKVYEELFGGFEDINSSDSSERSMDSEIYSDEEYTKEGYLKDSFIVDDDELEEEEYLEYSE